MTEAMPFLQKYDITFLRPLPILAGYIFLRPDMTGFSSPWGYNRSGEGGGCCVFISTVCFC